jgi:acyl-CoA thioesterase
LRRHDLEHAAKFAAEVTVKPLHPLDEATRLERLGPETLAGQTSKHYANMGGPFGGFTAAVLLRAVMEDERRQGAPVALTVNYCAAIAEGAFEISCRERRTGKSTQHWSLELTQGDRVAATASVVCGTRRPVWSHVTASPPAAPPADKVPVFDYGNRFGWLNCYEMRFDKGAVDFAPRDPNDLREPVTLVWMRDKPDRPLDYIALAALSDAFIIRAFVVRGVFTAVGTVSLTTFFHADEEAMRAQGAAPLLGHATAHVFSGGFFDQAAELWGKDGRLLATSTQIVWYKE